VLTDEAKNKIVELLKVYKGSLEKRKIPNKKFIIFSNVRTDFDNEDDKDDSEIVSLLYHTEIENFDLRLMPCGDYGFQNDNIITLIAFLRNLQYCSFQEKLDSNNIALKDNYVNFIRLVVLGSRENVKAEDIRLEVLMEHFNEDDCDLIAEDYNEIYNGNLRHLDNWLDTVKSNYDDMDFYFWHDLEKDIIPEVKYYENLNGYNEDEEE